MIPLLRLRRVHRRDISGDRGLSLVELLVGTALMGIFMAIFSYTMVMMYGASSKAQAIGSTASQVNQAFDRLDTSVRYASAITTPGLGGDGNWYVEWQTDHGAQPECTQLRLDVTAHTLQVRTWTVDPMGADGVTGWHVLATGVSAADAVNGPFAVPDDGSANPHERLSVHIRAAATDRHGQTVTSSNVTFAALNSASGNDEGGAACGGMR